MKTVRQEIIDTLHTRPMNVREISQTIGIPEKDVYFHLDHIRRSLKSEGRRLIIEPAVCRDCGYSFAKRERITPPGRCPKCRESHIRRPVYSVM